MAGQYKNGRYHGLDTLYRSNGTVVVGKYKNGKLVGKVADVKEITGYVKPEYPRLDLSRKQEDFLKDLELIWEERNTRIREGAGLVSPRFQGGSVNDFALWVNSKVEYPEGVSLRDGSRTVIVEFTVLADGSVSDAHAVFGSNTLLNAAAEEAVAKSPKWEPGEHDGQKRDVRMTVPVVFSNE